MFQENINELRLEYQMNLQIIKENSNQLMIKY